MKRICAVCTALLCLPLYGCSWRDAGDLSAVTAGAISYNGKDYSLTAELAIPNAETPTPDSETITGKAENIPQAIDNTGFGRSALLYWSHARVFLMGETVLKKGILKEIQDLTVSSEVRPSVRLCAVKGSKASDVLKECKSIDGNPAGFALGNSIDEAIQQSQAPDLPLYRVLDRVETQGVDPVLPAVSVKEKQAVLSGAALFSGDTLCGWLDEQPTTALCIMLGAGNSAVIYDDTMRYRLMNLSSSVSADTKIFTVNVRADIACESNGQAQKAASALRKQCVAVVEQLQKTGCDAVGFGRAWERADPAGYQKAGADAWRTVPVTVQVTLHATQSAEGGSR